MSTITLPDNIPLIYLQQIADALGMRLRAINGALTMEAVAPHHKERQIQEQRHER